MRSTIGPCRGSWTPMLNRAFPSHLSSQKPGPITTSTNASSLMCAPQVDPSAKDTRHFPAASFGLDPIEEVLIRASTEGHTHISDEVQESIDPNDIADLSLPGLAPLLKGFSKRYLNSGDQQWW